MRHLDMASGRRLILLLALLFAAPAGAQTTWYVASGGTGAGSSGDPLGSVQAAIGAAAAGDTIMVGPGTYLENINYLGKDLVLRSTDGPETTILDGGNTATVVSFLNGESNAATLDGFTITHGLGSSFRGGGIAIDQAAATIVNCIIESNDAGSGFNGAGISCVTGGTTYVLSSLIRDNVGTGNGSGIWVLGSTVKVGNCAIIENVTSNPLGVGGIRAGAYPLEVVNSIFIRNFPSSFGGSSGGANPVPTIHQTYCAYDSPSATGMGNINVAQLPLDLRLPEGSPLIDGGVDVYPWSGNAPSRHDLPVLDLAGDRRIEGRSVDIGLYETPYAPKTINVPGEFPTIQQAIDAAFHDDTIEVQAGVHAGFVWGGSRRLTIASTAGPSSTIIDGMLPRSGASVVEISETPTLPPLAADSVLDGFTIINGTDSGVPEKAAGLHVDSNSPTISRCIFRNNSGGQHTGAASVRAGLRDAAPTFTSCEFSGNTSSASTVHAAGVRSHDQGGQTLALPVFDGCTFATNSATGGGPGLFALESGPASMINSIVWSNAPAQISDPLQLLSAVHSNIEGGHPGAGNINADPQFVAPTTGDFHIALTSPCVDSGDPNSPTVAHLDVDGHPRVQCASIDMGTDETVSSGPCHIFVGPGGFAKIQAAIDASVNGDTITVLPGRYCEVIQFRGKAITLLGSGTTGPNATIIDGNILPGTIYPDSDGDYTPVLFYQGEGPATVMRNFRITNGVNPQASFSLDTLELANELGFEAPFVPHGGGILCYNASPTIEDCVIEGNTTEGTTALVAIGSETGSGGGIAVIGDEGHANPVFRRCRIENNSTGNGYSLLLDVGSGNGGGVYCEAQSATSSATVTLEDCVISGNACGYADGVTGNGGGICVIGTPGEANATAFIRDCQITGNMAGISNGTTGVGGSGGGLQGVSASIVIERTTLSGNRAGDSTRFSVLPGFSIPDPPIAALAHSGTGGSGGGISFVSGALLLRDCIVSDNRAGSSYECGPGLPGCANTEQVQFGGNGGGFFIGGAVNVAMTNCIITGNTSGDGGTPLANEPQNIAGNGGAIWISASFENALAMDIVHCTLADNGVGMPAAYRSGGWGGGIYFNAFLGGAIHTAMGNSIIHGNTGGNIFNNSDAFSLIDTRLDYTNFEDGWTGPGVGNIAVDPLFAAAPLDYRLSATSPCIDRGDANGIGVPTTDFEGDPRIVGSAPDMGADEDLSGSMPPGHPYPGSHDDLLLTTTLNGVGIPIDPIKAASTGDTLVIGLHSPAGTFIGEEWILLAAFFATGAPPAGIGYPDLHVFPGGDVLFSGATPLGNIPLAATGIGIGPIVIPPTLSGLSILMQGAVVSPLAVNGLNYAATDGHEIRCN